MGFCRLPDVQSEFAITLHQRDEHLGNGRRFGKPRIRYASGHLGHSLRASPASALAQPRKIDYLAV